MQQLRILKDSNGNQLPSLDWSRCDKFALTAGENRAVAVPTGARYAVFATDGSFAYFVAPGRSAAHVAGGDLSDGLAPRPCPVIVPVAGVTELHLFAAADGDLFVEWYR